MEMSGKISIDCGLHSNKRKSQQHVLPTFPSVDFASHPNKSFSSCSKQYQGMPPTKKQNIGLEEEKNTETRDIEQKISNNNTSIRTGMSEADLPCVQVEDQKNKHDEDNGEELLHIDDEEQRHSKMATTASSTLTSLASSTDYQKGTLASQGDKSISSQEKGHTEVNHHMTHVQTKKGGRRVKAIRFPVKVSSTTVSSRYLHSLEVIMFLTIYVLFSHLLLVAHEYTILRRI